MTGTARRVSRTSLASPMLLISSCSLIALASMTACGGAEGQRPASSTPAASAAVSPGPGAPVTSPVAAEAGPTAVGAATPSESGSWPFGPAPSEGELKAQAERLAKDSGPIKTNWTPPGKSDRYGHAEGLIDAPYDAVKARLLDFPHYRELAGPKFKKVNVVDKSASGTDLYFQLPIMKGLITLWYVTRFATARPGMGGAEVIEGKFVKGNIKDMQIVFTIRPAMAPEQKTVLVCDLNLAINVPAPQSALDEELRDACGDAVNAIRARTTQPPSP